MKLIAHRGNTEGTNPELENRPDYLLKALEKFDIEVDLWFHGNLLWTGHDAPTWPLEYNVFMDLLKNPSVWWHAKHYESLVYMLDHWPHTKVFAHETDTYGIVNSGYIWTASYTRPVASNRTIVMIPSRYIGGHIGIENDTDIAKLVCDKGGILGICCDDLRGL